MMNNFGLTGSMYPEPIKTLINPNYFEWGCNITYLAKPGKIEKIIGVDEVFSLPGVIDVVPAYHEGDTIAETAVGRLQQVILRVFATAATKEEMAQLMDQVHDTIKVKNTDGENMLLDVFDTQELFD